MPRKKSKKEIDKSDLSTPAKESGTYDYGTFVPQDKAQLPPGVLMERLLFGHRTNYHNWK